MEISSRPLYVIGHRNPDTDAVCSAIGYAAFLRASGQEPGAVAARCGTLNARTEFVLDRAGVEPPVLLLDAHPTAESICVKTAVHVTPEHAVYEVYSQMQARNFKSVPVVDGEGRVHGMLSLLGLLQLLFPHGDGVQEHRIVHTSLALVARTTGGEILCGNNLDAVEPLIQVVGAMSADGFESRMKQQPAERLIIVAGDRPTIQLPAIEYGVRCLVITGGCVMNASLLRLAEEKGVTVIRSPLDTANTTLMIRSAHTVGPAVNRDCVTVPRHARLPDFRDALGRSEQHLFPVIDDDRRLVGVFSKSDLVNARGLRLVLVDHNEMAQAVEGASEADIVEVLDHHRLGGGLVSREPIRFINEPVGSTSTIVAELFRGQDLPVDQGVGACLAAGIISDTLLLRSPTTTARDRAVLGWLEKKTGLDLEAFARDFFAAGSALQVKVSSDVLAEDRKAYAESGWTFAISQVEELGMDHFWTRRAELQDALDRSLPENNYDAAFLMITDITQQVSLLLCSGPSHVLGRIEYPEKERGLYVLKDVVSRKKQLLPYLIDLLSHVPGDEG